MSGSEDYGADRRAATHSDVVLRLVLVAWVLHVARGILVPLALSVLISFLLAPIVTRLERRRAPRVLAVLLAVGLAATLVAFAAGLVLRQAVLLAGELPPLSGERRAKLSSLPAGPLQALAKTLESLEGPTSSALATGPTPAPADYVTAPAAAAPAEPVRVAVVPPARTAMDLARGLLSPLVGPLGTIGLIAVFVIFLLLKHEDLARPPHPPDRQGPPQPHHPGDGRSFTHVGRYLQMQFLVNAGCTIPIGLGLWLISVPHAALWALIAFVLRYVPYVGPLLAGAMPTMLALAVFEGWLRRWRRWRCSW